MPPTKREKIDDLLYKHMPDETVFCIADIVVLMKTTKDTFMIPYGHAISRYLRTNPNIEDLGVVRRYADGTEIETHSFRYHKPKESLWMIKKNNMSRYAKKKF